MRACERTPGCTGTVPDEGGKCLECELFTPHPRAWQKTDGDTMALMVAGAHTLIWTNLGEWMPLEADPRESQGVSREQCAADLAESWEMVELSKERASVLAGEQVR